MKTVLHNHLYEFDGQMYRQKEEGPIGENITQIAADLVMFKLMGGFKERLKRLNLVAILLKLYVDDLNKRQKDELRGEGANGEDSRGNGSLKL